MVLRREPGIYAYSESGSGTGYSYVSIRGFDQSRISVLIDGVPLNDNESHEVYWVDHGDILSGAGDVQIQRGIGNTLYGASAFGGAINVQTRVHHAESGGSFSLGGGSYNTLKGRLEVFSGPSWKPGWEIAARYSGIVSDGYRVDSRSKQHALFLGINRNAGRWQHAFRALMGKEISILQWDGIDKASLGDREARRGKLSWVHPFKDDFLQQIYSLNSTYRWQPGLVLRNVAYAVFGSGFYEVRKYGVDYYSYNLDRDDVYPDSVEIDSLSTDLLRRKWIVNQYFGITPVLTWEQGSWRLDAGLEARTYRGNHFGEVMEFSDSLLAQRLPQPYRYYDYTGRKISLTPFVNVRYQVGERLFLNAGLQAQYHRWSLDQEPIVHFPGYRLKARWLFINPRLGATWQLEDNLSLFFNWGIARKEPAAKEILNGSDVWDMPHKAAAEEIYDTETGLRWTTARGSLVLNGYVIDYRNEVLSKIYDFAQSEFDVKAADMTRHAGLEMETSWRLSHNLRFMGNYSWSINRYESGTFQGNTLPNTVSALANLGIGWQFLPSWHLNLSARYAGRQYIDDENTVDLAIPAAWVTGLDLVGSVGRVEMHLKIDNLNDALYSTYGYAWGGEGYYWPGATRNGYLVVKVNL